MFLLGFLVFAIYANGQVGINTTNPDSSAVLDLKSINKGLLIPTMTTTQREAMTTNPPATGLANGLLVFDSDMYQFFFYDSSVGKWIAVNPWRKEYTDAIGDAEHVTTDVNSVSNIGIGLTNPSSKLSVNGNLSVGNTNTGASANGVFSDGNINTEQKVQEDGYDLLPAGTIVMWSGTSAPAGWGLCDGTTYTKLNGGLLKSPDLSGKFIVGYNSGDFDYNQPGDLSTGGTTTSDVGGETSHILSIPEMPSHVHDISHTHVLHESPHTHSVTDRYSSGQQSVHTITTQNDAANDHWTNNTRTTSAATTGITIDAYSGDSGSTGSGVAHENRPPYYTLAFIIKL